MKNKIVLLIGLLVLSFTISAGEKGVAREINSVNDSITVFCSPDLYNLTTKWASEYSAFNTAVAINVINDANTSLNEELNSGKGICFISSKYTDTHDGSMWNIIVGRDVIVPVFNSKNPLFDEINLKGISPEALNEFFSNPEKKNWGTLLNSPNTTPVNLYLLNDESINSGLAKWVTLDERNISGIKVASGNDLISSVQSDPNSIGICKITDINDTGESGLAGSVSLLPIDRNGNGKLDYMENIYDDLTVLSRSVWIGKYPDALFNNIYSISSVKPTNESEAAFLKWVLTDGQQYLGQYGYSNLLFSERQAKVDMLNDNTATFATSKAMNTASNGTLLILGGLIAIVLVVIMAIGYINKRTEIWEKASISTLVLNKDSIEIPQGLFYDKTHTWAFMEQDGMVRIGVDDFLQHITGPLTRIKMRNTGDKVRKGEHVLSIIQNGKQLNIYAPISGTIKEQNKVLITNTSVINSAPFSDGWVYRIEPANWLKEIQFLNMVGKYKEWLQSEYSRLKEFLTASVNSKGAEYGYVLQDGGELKNGILVGLGPEVWEDFQTNFIDASK